MALNGDITVPSSSQMGGGGGSQFCSPDNWCLNTEMNGRRQPVKWKYFIPLMEVESMQTLHGPRLVGVKCFSSPVPIMVSFSLLWIYYVLFIYVFLRSSFLPHILCLCTTTYHLRRSQCPRGGRHELFSPVWTLESWVRIPLKAWMSVCVYSVFMFSV
jgi:hypothetical protein